MGGWHLQLSSLEPTVSYQGQVEVTGNASAVSKSQPLAPPPRLSPEAWSWRKEPPGTSCQVSTSNSHTQPAT